MADLIITVANIIPVAASNPQIESSFLAAATITRGQSVYLTASSTWNLADNDGAALLAGSGGLGISLSDVVSGQPMMVMRGGTLGFGAILTAGTIYVVSSTAGAICPWADLGSSDFVSILGVASTTSNLLVRPWATGVEI